MLNLKKNKKQVCANCHFLYLNRESYPTGEPAHFGLNINERDNIRIGNFDAVTKTKEGLFFDCHQNVWSEWDKSSRNNEYRQKIINETSRKGSNCFVAYKPGMLLTDAKELQKRNFEAYQASKVRRYAIVALWISGFALVVSIVFSIITILKK